MEAIAPETNALFPLTEFDKLFQRTTFSTGWLIKGTIDAEKLGFALDRMTRKWRMLSGRLCSIKNNNEISWYLRIPLSELPPDYRTYALTTTISEVPLSHYVSVPIPSCSSSLPPSLFIHTSTPRQYTAWEMSGHPITCWHLTYFPADKNNGQSYTCLGFSRSHGIFDGVGASLIMNALVAEMRHESWQVPPLPIEGMNTNATRVALDNIQSQKNVRTDSQECEYSILGITGTLKMVAGHIWQKWWSGADRRTLLLPNCVQVSVVDRIRSELNQQENHKEKVTTGDILVAWLLKTIYAQGTSPETVVHCSNFASFRPHLSTNQNSLLAYPHNAFVPLPYPVFSVKDLNSISICNLALIFAASRTSLTPSHVISASKMLKQSPTCFPVHPAAHETLFISNVSASRILESDWSAVGGEETLCGYRYQLTPTDVLFTNAVYIAGRLSDGTVVLDLSLNTVRLDLLVKEVNKIFFSVPPSSR